MWIDKVESMDKQLSTSQENLTIGVVGLQFFVNILVSEFANPVKQSEFSQT